MSDEADIGPPKRLSSDHDLSAFNSGNAVLDDWLRRRAHRNQERGGARTYVICADKRAIGYYALAAGAVAQAEATGRAQPAAVS